MFSDLQERLSKTVKNLKGLGKIREENIAQAIDEVKENLLASDVQYRVVQSFVDSVKEKALGLDVSTNVDPGQQFVKILFDQLREMLGENAAEIPPVHGRPLKVLMMGLQGSGKTTSSAKLAYMFKHELGRHPLLVAADTARPGAREQLQKLAEKDALKFYTHEGDDSRLICKNALSKVEGRELLGDVLIFDTAGRLAIDELLMKELQQLKDAVKPDLSLYVLDSMAGQSAANVALEFFNKVGFDGLVLTKTDSDTRGGAALSVYWTTKKPIYFVGTGEKLSDFEKLYPERLASRILDMGDVVSLVEQAQKVFDEKQASKMASKMKKNAFTVEDFAEQMNMIKKLGSMDKILGMLPGGAKIQKAIPAGVPEKEMVKIDAIIKSMTPRERRNIQIIDGSRRRRIANGSGTTVTDVNRFLKQFVEAKKMASQLGNMGLGALMKGSFMQQR
ncbi:MAG: signal recognition particle protein [Bdellovibrionales bacterium]|nr:signal recognition particle protein [Bdellovibrionales bacterium]